MKKLFALLLALAMIFALVACGGGNDAKDDAAKNNAASDAKDDAAKDDAAKDEGEEVTIVKIGIGTNAMPNCYLDENGNLAGENYEVMCLVDEMLPQYEFQYETGTQDAIIIGLDTGTYAVGMNNFFYNDERAEKYLFPEYPVSAGVRGLCLRREYESQITPGTSDEVLSQVAKLGLRNVPVSSSESSFTLYDTFNKSHTEQVIFEVAEHDPIAQEVQQVINGRYDMFCDLRSSYTSVKDEMDPNDETYFLCFNGGGFGTWILYGKDQQELVDAVDGCMEKLYADGTMAAMAQKWYGENVYQYIPDFKYADVAPNPNYK